MIGRTYLERGRPVVVLTRWGPPIRSDHKPGPRTVLGPTTGPPIPAHGGGPRNVLIRRERGELVVRPFRGLRRAPGEAGR